MSQEEVIPTGSSEEVAAATRIQALQRGKAARKETKELSAKAAASGEPGAPAEPAAAEAAEPADPRAPPVAEPAAAEAEPRNGGASEDWAATRIQAVHRGKAARKQVSDRINGAGAAPQPSEVVHGSRFEVTEAIVEAYLAAAGAAGRKASRGIETSLRESVERGGETFVVEAPGNHKLAFVARLEDQDASVLVQALGSFAPCLGRVDLSYNHLTDEGATLLAEGLLAHGASKLTALSLRANSIGSTGCVAVCSAVAQGCPTLRRLDIAQNPVGRNGGLAVADLILRRPDVLEIFLADTEIEIDALVAMSAVLLRGQSQLKVCDIENPRIATLQEDHTVHLGRMLRVNTHISELYIGKHKMRDDGVRQLVSFLLENKTLRILDLRCNELGAQGAKHLGNLLASDCQLSSLNLSGNRMGEKGNTEGAQALARALGSNRMLAHLDLNHNGFVGEALQALADAVDKHSTLESIRLFHNQWDQLASYRFHQILQDRARILPLCADFITSEVDFRIDICKVGGDFQPPR